MRRLIERLHEHWPDDLPVLQYDWDVRTLARGGDRLLFMILTDTGIVWSVDLRLDRVPSRLGSERAAQEIIERIPRKREEYTRPHGATS
jgi:hypothetical protein